MFNSELTRAVENFAALLLPVSEKDLEQEWKWKDHDEEGARFAFFVTIQELRQLAVGLSALRTPPTAVQQILGQYHAQYMDLQAAILGLTAEDADRVPAEGEWSVRRVYSHILGADVGFSAVVRYALEKHRAVAWRPERMSDEDEMRLIGMNEDEYQALTLGPLEGMMTYHRGFHSRIVREFSTITDKELDLPSTFWEETRFPIRHRLHRFEAHIVQHTVQIDKTLALLGLAPSESKRLFRYVYASLAEVDNMLIGQEISSPIIMATSHSIMQRTKELSNLLER